MWPGHLLLWVVAALFGGAPSNATGPAEPGRSAWTVGDVCDNRVERFEWLSQVEQLRTGPGEAAAGEAACAAEPRRLLDQLKQVLVLNLELHACGPQTGDLYGSIWAAAGSLPRAARAFAADLGREISAQCKVNLLQHLGRLDSFVSADELAQVQQLERAGAFLIGGQLEPDSPPTRAADPFQLAAELGRMLAASGRPMKPRVKLDGRSERFLGQLRFSCLWTYRPVFGQLLSTLGKLHELGLGYHSAGPLFADFRRRYQAPGGPVRRWLNVMLLCQVLSEASMFDRLRLERGQDWLQNWRVDGDTFASVLLPDELLLDSSASAAELQQLDQRSNSESRRWAVAVYERLLGHKPAVSTGAQLALPAALPADTFARAYLLHVAERLRAARRQRQ